MRSKSLEQILAVGIVAILAPNQSNSAVKKQFCAAEQLVWNAVNYTNTENRLYLNGSMRFKDATISTHSYNSVNGANSKSYFGVHQLGIGSDKVQLLGEAKLVGQNKPIYGTGFRVEEGLPKSTYGYTNFVLSKKGISSQVTSGYVLKHFTLEATLSASKPYCKKPNGFVELQILGNCKQFSPFFAVQRTTYSNDYKFGAGVRANF